MPRKDRKLSIERVQELADHIRETGGSWRDVGVWAKERWGVEAPGWQALNKYAELRDAMLERHRLGAHEARTVLLNAQPSVCNGILERLRFMQTRMAQLEQAALADGKKLPTEYNTLATQFRYYAKIYAELASELGKQSGESFDVERDAGNLEALLAKLNTDKSDAGALEKRRVKEEAQKDVAPLRIVEPDAG